MADEFKQCPNGHYYQGAKCPYCKTTTNSGNAPTLDTEVFPGGGMGVDPTLVDPVSSGGKYTKTKRDGASTQVVGDPVKPPVNRTIFGSDMDDAPIGMPPSKEPRYGRKLVGWLVTYSHDELGMDFKLYEGRNIIGRDIDCNITVDDGRMSGKHAVLLFRANKYSLTDSQSSHGTFVNEEDIELEPRYLKDGDIIRMGKTIFKFRTSL